MKKTRFKIALYTTIFLSGFCVLCLWFAKEHVGTAMASLSAVALAYIGGDSYRKSEE